MRFDFDAIASDDDVTLLGGNTFQDSADGTSQDSTVIGLCDRFQAVNANDGAFEGSVRCFQIDVLKEIRVSVT
jgi:hypothetical protein